MAASRRQAPKAPGRCLNPQPGRAALHKKEMPQPQTATEGNGENGGSTDEFKFRKMNNQGTKQQRRGKEQKAETSALKRFRRSSFVVRISTRKWGQRNFSAFSFLCPNSFVGRTRRTGDRRSNFKFQLSAFNFQLLSFICIYWRSSAVLRFTAIQHDNTPDQNRWCCRNWSRS